jgi:hypothetical protein
MANQDIILDYDNDFLIQNGDFVIDESEEQEIKMILQAVKNDYKQFPELGVNLVEFMSKSASNVDLAQTIKMNLKMDGKTHAFKIKDGEIQFQ